MAITPSHLKPVSGVQIAHHLNAAPYYLNAWNRLTHKKKTLQKSYTCMPALEVARSHSSCILSFDLTGHHQNKRFYVTEIVWRLGFADVTFRVERSDDRKYIFVLRLLSALTGVLIERV